MDWFVSRFNEVAYNAWDMFEAGKWPQATLIYGGTGLGKSRILWGMYQKVLTERPGDRPLCLGARAFATEYSLAAQEGRLGSFRRMVRSSGFLFIDDLQELKGKEKTIEELFHTCDHIMEQGGKVAAVLEAKDLKLSFLGERLASRFLSGLILALDWPEPKELHGFAEFCLQGKLAILDPEIVDGMAAGAKTLAEIKRRCEAFLSYLERQQAEATAKEFNAFWKTQEEEFACEPIPENILKLVSEMYGLTITDILGRRRFPQIVEARSLAIYAVRTICRTSYAEISRMFNREHGAIIHAFQGFEEKLAANQGLRTRLETIKQVFSNKSAT